MARLSVNINKIATLRNARGTGEPNVLQAGRKVLDYGAQGLTLHPRPDGRHILYQDVIDAAQLVRQHNQQIVDKSVDNSPNLVELNIEGYPSPKFLQLIQQVRPHQCTLVPDKPEALTSNAGWALRQNQAQLVQTLIQLKLWGVRSSLFVDPFALNPSELQALIALKPDRVELYTQAYAEKPSTLATYSTQAQRIAQYGIDINAGHDLNQKNLGPLLQSIPQIKEVSIGHALICEALYEGLHNTIKNYLKIINPSYKNLNFVATKNTTKQQDFEKLSPPSLVAARSKNTTKFLPLRGFYGA